MDQVLVTGNASSIDSRRFLREGVSRDAEHYGKVKQEVPTFSRL